jgi:hypothetical protein
MRTLSKLLLSLLLTVLAVGGLSAQTASGQEIEERIVTFRFVPDEDMFYIPYGGNDAELNRLYALVDEYRTEITAGKLPVRVDGYCASLPTTEENFKTAVVRSNHVKSELITNKGLAEENFITKNHVTACTAPDGKTYRDMVVVTLRIPVKAATQPDTQAREQAARERAEAERLAAEQAEAERAAEQARLERQERERLAAEQAEKERTEAERLAAEALAAAKAKPYRVAIRTNLLYDVFLMPTLGVEWRVNRNIGIKADYSFSHWGSEKGKVQKMWLVSPEVRWYLLDGKRFYVGVGGNYGEYNIYKGMVGGLFSDDTGYQGKLWNVGVTVGYLLKLSHAFSLDLNLGLGYTRSEYDSFTISNETRIYKEKNKTKNFRGPTQAGVSLVWTLGK